MTQAPPPGAPRARIPGPKRPPSSVPRIRAGLWKHWLWGGLALWTLTAVVTYATRDTTLLPTLILLGSFLVPGTFVLWAYERHARDLGVSLMLGCFVVGGILGVLGASVMEYYLLHPSLWMFVGVGLIEEAVKLAALMYMLRRQPRVRGLRAGLVLGASVGFGFAAFESAGHAFNAAVGAQGIDLRSLLETEVLRGLLAPFGHGLWTAISGAVLLAFRRPNGRYRFAAPVVLTCLGVSFLHALWDSMHGIAIWIVARLTATDLPLSLFAEGFIPQPTDTQKHLFTLFSVGGLVIISLAGIAWVRSLARSDPSWRNTP
ncbi:MULTISPECIES: PrsW family intramembrane metalloprotease [unclassified Streptomyces]|uniref:PrsW family intramembrane metalloprotease n=1 Tax=unclassified Streptomyces TaxID=2593676 RepID=UPI0022513693|nr:MULTISPECIES: PrsW family intramembrane metalloprotease [unclassified Streptomyces]MCX4645345.1 PrsW family intramembrane metalloprotease [Streptomyces sp. NBC_01446]MCX5325887.1 PrsW family intramembrane metalloprotease [Streptomyces sp. NBC_00120]